MVAIIVSIVTYIGKHVFSLFPLEGNAMSWPTIASRVDVKRATLNAYFQFPGHANFSPGYIPVDLNGKRNQYKIRYK